MPEGMQAPHTKLLVCENETVLSLKSFRGEHGGMGERKVEKKKSCQKLKASGQGSGLCNSSHTVRSHSPVVSVASPFSPLGFDFLPSDS